MRDKADGRRKTKFAGRLSFGGLESQYRDVNRRISSWRRHLMKNILTILTGASLELLSDSDSMHKKSWRQRASDMSLTLLLDYTTKLSIL